MEQRSRVLLEKLIVAHLVMKFTVFYGIQKFISACVRDHQCSLI